MTNEEIAYELQGINGILISAEGAIERKHLEVAATAIRYARAEVVALARQFEPPLHEPECSCGYNPETGYRFDLVCPKHDGIRYLREPADRPQRLIKLGRSWKGTLDWETIKGEVHGGSNR